MFFSIGMSVPVRSHSALNNELIAFLLRSAVSEYPFFARRDFCSELHSAFEFEVFSQPMAIFWAWQVHLLHPQEHSIRTGLSGLLRKSLKEICNSCLWLISLWLGFDGSCWWFAFDDNGSLLCDRLNNISIVCLIRFNWYGRRFASPSIFHHLFLMP